MACVVSSSSLHWVSRQSLITMYSWLNHDSWGNYSEIDIIEGVVPQTFSDISL